MKCNRFEASSNKSKIIRLLWLDCALGCGTRPRSSGGCELSRWTTETSRIKWKSCSSFSHSCSCSPPPLSLLAHVIPIYCTIQQSHLYGAEILLWTSLCIRRAVEFSSWGRFALSPDNFETSNKRTWNEDSSKVDCGDSHWLWDKLEVFLRCDFIAISTSLSWEKNRGQTRGNKNKSFSFSHCSGRLRSDSTAATTHICYVDGRRRKKI